MDFKNYLMNISIFALVPLWRQSNKKENQEDLRNRIMRPLEITNQNHLLTIAFPPIGNGLFGFYSDLRGTIMLQTMRDFISKSSNLSLKIIHVVDNNIRQVKPSLELCWQIIREIIYAEGFVTFYSFILLNI